MNKEQSAFDDDESIMTFVEGNADWNSVGKILYGIKHNDGFCDKLRFGAKALLAEKQNAVSVLNAEDRQAVEKKIKDCLANRETSTSSFLWKMVRERLEMFLQTGNDEKEVVAAGDNERKILFCSTGPKNSASFWTAIFELPESNDKNNMIKIVVRKSKNRDLLSGILCFCGMSIRIENGVGILSLASLRDNLDKGGISFEFPDGRVLPGFPVFGC